MILIRGIYGKLITEEERVKLARKYQMNRIKRETCKS